MVIVPMGVGGQGAGGPKVVGPWGSNSSFTMFERAKMSLLLTSW